MNKQILEQIKVSPKLVMRGKYFQDDKEERNIYKIFIEFNGKKTSFRFGDSIANTYDDKRPEKNDLLETITSDYFYTTEYYPTFQDFASEFGYDEDSRKAEKTYKACLEQAEKLHSVFTDSDIEQIREALEL